MQSLNFESKLKRYCINNDESKVIEFDPSDITIIERINESQKVFDELKNVKPKSESVEDVAEALKEVNQKIRNQINYIFDADIADTVFGNKNPMSTYKGVPLFERFIESVIPEIKNALKSENELIANQVKKYTDITKEFK